MRSEEQARGVPSIGILGGGQLAKMMVLDARRIGFETAVLDPDPSAPALSLADASLSASFGDLEAVRALARRVDVITFDLENVDTEVCLRLQAEGLRFAPDPAMLAVVQDKLVQKTRLRDAGLPVPHFEAADGDDPTSLSRLGFPVFQKVRRAGYDGRGVRRLAGEEDLAKALPGPSLVQRPVAISKELAVLVVRGRDGSCRTYDPVEMVFDSSSHRLAYLRCPVDMPGREGREMLAHARALALRATEALGAVGVLAVELFWDRSGQLWVNEVAPRPHNSGHHTIEAAATSQFEQHLRAVAGLPLGSTELLHPCAMANLVGRGERDGPLVVEGLEDVLSMPGIRLHLYGKKRCRPGRKMGHVTALHEDPEEAVRAVLEAQRHLVLRGGDEPSGQAEAKG